MGINNQFIGNLKGLKLELDFKIGDLDSDIKSLKKASRQNVGPEIIKRINPIFLSAKFLSFPNILSQFRIVSNTYKGVITIILDVITNHGAK